MEGEAGGVVFIAFADKRRLLAQLPLDFRRPVPSRRKGGDVALTADTPLKDLGDALGRDLPSERDRCDVTNEPLALASNESVVSLAKSSSSSEELDRAVSLCSIDEAVRRSLREVYGTVLVNREGPVNRS